MTSLYPQIFSAPRLQTGIGKSAPTNPKYRRTVPYEDRRVLNPSREAAPMVKPLQNKDVYPSVPDRPHTKQKPPRFYAPGPDRTDIAPSVVSARSILDLGDQDVPLHDIERVTDSKGQVHFYKYNRGTGTYTLYGRTPPVDHGKKLHHEYRYFTSDYFHPPILNAPMVSARPHSPDEGFGYVPSLVPVPYAPI